jgi:D-glycero-alpha-D-manno-heptose-7-phosphate kinase
MLFFTDITRQSSTILAEQKLNINGKLENLRRMKSQAVEACRHPEAGDLSGIGELLDETWHLKKQLASRVSNGVIKEMYRAVRQAGTLGGKISRGEVEASYCYFAPINTRIRSGRL